MIARTLLKNEFIKAWHRLAFWVALGLYALMNGAGFGGQFYEASRNPDRTFALPEAWRQIYDDPTLIGLIFGCALIILLVSSEFSWRTARQNVIDGLTKEQFFAAKLMVLPLVALIFMVGQTLIGGSLAFAGTDLSQASGPLFGRPQLSFLLALFVTFLGYSSLALLSATSIRNAGPAMAIWFFYMAFGEQLIRSALGRIGEGVRDALQYMPIASFNRLLEYVQHDPVAFQAAVERAVERERQMPEAFDLTLWYGVSSLWIVALIAISFVWFRKRDL